MFMRIDAHHHVWDLAVRDQPWTATHMPELNRRATELDSRRRQLETQQTELKAQRHELAIGNRLRQASPTSPNKPPTGSTRSTSTNANDCCA
jgi:hypothetical protein